MNPTHSVKDRIGTNMINAALEAGLINKDTIVIEPTSGNTGIALASVCAALGIKLILTMPASMSIERRRLLKSFRCTTWVNTTRKGMKGAIDRAVELKEVTPNSFIPQQFQNAANPEIHRKTTAQEILRDTDGKIDILVAAIGTGGTITGTGEVLKAHNPNIQIIAVEPEASPVLSGGKPGPHKNPRNWCWICSWCIKYKNLWWSYSSFKWWCNWNFKKSCTNWRFISWYSVLVQMLYVASKIAARPENKGKLIVTILCDTGRDI